MKKRLLFGVFIALSTGLSAQSILLKGAGNVTLNDDTVTYTHLVDTVNFQLDFKHDEFVTIVNNTSASMSIDLIREEIQIIPGSGDYFCWGSECKLEKLAGTEPVWAANDPVMTAPGDSAGGLAPLSIYISHNNNVGTAILKYTFRDGISGSEASVFVKWILEYPTVTSDAIRLVDLAGNELNDDTLTFTHGLDTTMFQLDFKHEKFLSVINNSQSSMDIDLIREEIQIIPGSGDYYCWGSECKLEKMAGTEPVWAANDPVTTAQGDTAGGAAPLAIYVSPNGNVGTAILKYTFRDINSGSEASVYTKWIITYITSIEENELANQFSIFPNPAVDNVTINFDQALNFNRQSVEIYNILGEKVNELNIGQGEQIVELNTSNLNSGIYFVNIMVDGVRAGSKKLIVK